MEIQSGPNAVDEPNLLYKLQRKIKVFNTNNALPNRGYNLVACTSRYGLVFVASPNGVLSVYYLKELIDKECEPQHLSVNLQIQPTHIAVNCNQEWLAVIGGQMLVVYKCMDFQNPDIRPSVTIKCDVSPSTFVSALQWNPCIPDTIGIIYFDGTLLVSQVSTMQVKKIQSNARCLCWSPKGKQVVTGNNDGTLTQYKPDLSPMKMVPAPNLFEGSPLEALAIYWIATYQFAVAYRNSSNNSRPAVTIVNTPKAGTPLCYNYDDICYSMGSNRPWYYYLQGLAQWNIILSSSSNSMEIATLSTTDGSNWIQWCQTDEARPELPLTDKKQENYPVGICIDTVAIHQLPWGENETLPPMPLLHVVSQTGLLSIFNIINLNKSASQICTALQPLALPAAALTRNIPDDVPSHPEPPPAVVQPKPQQQSVSQQPQQQAMMQQQQQAMMQQQQQQAMMQQQQQTMMQQQQQQAMMQQQQQQAMIQQQQAMMQQQQSMMQQQQQSIAQQQQQQSIVQQQSVVQPQPIASESQRQKTIIAPVKTIPQQQSNLSFAPAATKESTPAVATSSITGPQPKPTVQVPKPRVPSAEVSAALKSEQEKINKAKVNEELKNMLIKEVNDFQMELYNFLKLSQEKRDKFQQDIQSINLNAEINMDTESLRKECEIDELRESVTQLKLELVRACAVVAEARTQAEANCRHEWTQMDPLTAKRISSVKKLAYYVQTQLDQALKSLDHKWNEMAARDKYAKPGERMIRPILDDVYQPLVKQQEILSRQQAELKTLRNAMNECNFTPMFRSTTLLRSTPFRNKDPLSKLTKNILNMNIEPKNKAKEQLLNSQKLDALRDVLSNHRPRKVKPVNVELTQHLETMKQRYAKSLKEKEEKKELEQAALKVEPKEELKIQTTIKQEKPLNTFSKPQLPLFSQMSVKTENPKPVTSNMQSFTQKLTDVPPLNNHANIFTSQRVGGSIAFAFGQSPAMEPKPDIVKESPAITQSYAPVTLNVKPTKPASVVRTLFTEDASEKPVETIQKPQAQTLPQVGTEQPKQLTNQETKILLRKMILKEGVMPADSTIKAEPKNDSNTFMGQNICSPAAFNFSKPTATAPAAVFASKPITDMTNMFNKLQHQTTGPTVSSTVNPKSDETGEAELSKEKVKEEKPITNMFSLKTTTPLNSKNQNVPDVLKSSSQGFVFGKTENKSIPKVVEEKSKENVPDKPKEPKAVVENKNDNELKPPIAPVTTSKAPAQAVIIVDLKKPAAEAKVEKVPSSIFSGAPVSPPPTVSKPQSEPVTQQQPVVEISISSTTPANLSKPVTVTTTASKTVLEQTVEQSNNTSINDKEAKPSEIIEIKEDSKVETSKQDNVAPSVSASVFSSTNTGIALNTSLNTTSTATVITSESKPSVFSTATPSSIFSSTPQSFTSQPPVFASNASSVFATASAAVFGPQTTQSSIFGTTTSTSSAFGTATTSSIFGSTSSAQSIFSSAASKSIFGTTPASTSQSIFGTTPTTTQASVFGTNQSVFGTSTSNSGFGAPSTQASIFGSPSKPTSVFGSPTQTTQASVFGTPTRTTQASVFGTPTQTTQASVFGTPTQTTQASVFGTPTQTNQSSVFGTPTQTTQASVFGTPTQTTQASVFGTPTQTTQASVFGTPTQTTQASVFDTPTQTTRASIFGTPTTTTQSGSLFGNAESNLFAAASISTTSAPSQASGGSIFGSSSGSVFGSSNTSVFGSKTGFTDSNPTATNIFGGSAAFGQKPATDFWSGGSNTTTFGSSGFGQQATTQSSSIFGTSGGSFSAPSTGQPFGSPGPFSGGESKSIFGSPQQQSAPGAFGGSPVFGSKPVFGGSSGFGSSAFGGFNKSPSSGFGAPASFGGTAFGGNAFGNTSPNKVFGSSSPNFGSPTQSNATFENLATQNTLTFGNLAQQSGQAPQAAPSFNASPSFTGWRG